MEENHEFNGRRSQLNGYLGLIVAFAVIFVAVLFFAVFSDRDSARSNNQMMIFKFFNTANK